MGELLGMAKDTKPLVQTAERTYEGIDECVDDVNITCAPTMQFCRDVVTTDYVEALDYRINHLAEENFERPVIGVPDCRLPVPQIDCSSRPVRYDPNEDEYLERVEVLQQLLEIGTIQE